MVSRVSERGQITIDRAARKQLGVQPGMIAHQRVVNGRLEVVFLPAPHRRSLYGVFYREGEPPRLTTPEEVEEAVMEAIAEEQEREEEEHWQRSRGRSAGPATGWTAPRWRCS